MKRLKRRCSWCRSACHTDRHDKNDRAVCPERRKFEARVDRAQALRAHGDCTTCGAEPATVEMILGKVKRKGERTYWVGQRCAAMWRQLALALGGNPGRRPALEV